MSELEHELQILKEIERDPDVTQADLATHLGVAVGKINWHIKRLVGKGYVKVTHLQRRKLHYFLTPAGLALKVKLTRSYMDVSLRVYRELRQAAQEALSEVRQAGYTAVRIEGKDEAAEILRLTCLEQNIAPLRSGAPLRNDAPSKQGASTYSKDVPILRADGTGFVIQWPGVQLERNEVTYE
jgi:DNA-binding MarR family transcriptional regulator